MKWREPWAASLKQQQPFNLLGREVLQGMAIWTATLAALGLLANFGEDLAIQLERLARLWIAPAIGVPLAMLIYAAEWLSPRHIDSGPNGIVVSKGDRIVLIPWQAIKGYAFTRSAGHNALHMVDAGNGSHLFYLADKVHPKEVERELVRMTGKHPDDSFKPASLHSST